MARIGVLVLAGYFAFLTGSAALAQQPGQPPKGQPNIVAQPGTFRPTIGQTPWFGDPAVRQQFRFSDDMYNRLNRAYGDAWTAYQKGVNQLGPKLSEAERAQRMRELELQFYSNYRDSTKDIFTDQAQRDRFDQMSWQYRGYGAFSDPLVQQRLNLTPEQRQQLDQLNQDWTKQMNEFNQSFPTDREKTTIQFTDARKRMDERLNTILNQQQQQTWRQMTGEPFNFPPSIWFQNRSNIPVQPK